jgi:hypothetical protein
MKEYLIDARRVRFTLHPVYLKPIAIAQSIVKNQQRFKRVFTRIVR